MKRSKASRLASLIGAAAALGLAVPNVAGADSHGKNIAIEFNDAGVHPAVAKVAEGGSVAFDNDSSSLAAVAFPIDIMKRLECKDARPDWQTESEALVSMPLMTDAPDLILPCALKKGEYPFKVRLFDSLDNMDNPKRALDGKLVVE